MLVVTSNHADDKTPKEAPKEPSSPSKDSYVKIRVEVEMRGILPRGRDLLHRIDPPDMKVGWHNCLDRRLIPPRAPSMDDLSRFCCQNPAAREIWATCGG
jgi:hypothetical protein